MEYMQIVIWAAIGLIYAGYGYLTNKIGDWSIDFQGMRFLITIVMGAIVGVILSLLGVTLTPETVVLYLQMPLFAGLGVLYIIERAVKMILEKLNTPAQFIP
jgi:hypothetical protein